MDLEGRESIPNAVVLPCEPDQFRDFIAGLLGKPQTINRVVYGPYDFAHSDAENIFHLIEQRVVSQNEAKLIQFTARIVYDDNSSILLNSFSAFQAYREVKPLVSTSAHFSWTYLIRFKDKKYPEKQQIELSVATSSAYRMSENVVFDVPDRLGAPMRIQISHTNRTWGTDIEALLVGHLGMFVKNETGARALIARCSGRIGFGVAAVMFASTLAMSFRVTDSFIDRYLSEAKKFATSDVPTFEVLGKKVDFLTQVVASGMWTRYAFYVIGFFVGSLIVSIAIGVFVGANAGAARPSFVLLTKRSEEMRAESLRKYRNSWILFVSSIVGALIVAVVGNYLFYKLSQVWAL